jgi:hypothetical protein
MDATKPKVRLQAYTLADMVPGDRFYLTADKKKQAVELHSDMPFEKRRIKGFWRKMARCVADNKTAVRHVTYHYDTTHAIFLKHNPVK